jgi:hypothetical protein
MFLRRFRTSLQSQHWAAFWIDIVVLVIGVFLGIQASNWNDKRLERRETRELLTQLNGQIGNILSTINNSADYYASAEEYAERADAGWSGDPTVSDSEFVIAAYQASQITAVGFNSGVWSTIFGAENVRDIEDPRTREYLAEVMSFDYDLINLRAVASRYREEVRKTIPHRIQAAIRKHCGDRQLANGLALPPRCNLQLTPDEAAKAAAELRSRPELASELRWHQAAVANQLTQMGVLRQNLEDLAPRIGAEIPDR